MTPIIQIPNIPKKIWSGESKIKPFKIPVILEKTYSPRSSDTTSGTTDIVNTYDYDGNLTSTSDIERDAEND